MKRRGFTLIELIFVIGIISVLLTIVFTVSTSAFRSARQNKAKHMRDALQVAFNTFYAQKGRWPEPLGKWVEDGALPERPNGLGLNSDNPDDPYILLLDNDEIDEMIRDVVSESRKGNPLIDLSVLSVARTGGPAGSKNAIDFLEAIRGTKQSKKKMKLAEMTFGYPKPATGRLTPFYVAYYRTSGVIRVKLMDDDDSDDKWK